MTETREPRVGDVYAEDARPHSRVEVVRVSRRLVHWRLVGWTGGTHMDTRTDWRADVASGRLRLVTPAGGEG